MSHTYRVILRAIIFSISLISVIYFQRTIGRFELLFMTLGLSGILWVLYDYNRGYR